MLGRNATKKKKACIFCHYGAVFLTSNKEQPIQKENSKTVCCNLFTQQLLLNTDINLLF